MSTFQPYGSEDISRADKRHNSSLLYGFWSSRYRENTFFRSMGNNQELKKILTARYFFSKWQF